jgi:HlyD family secretion protein
VAAKDGGRRLATLLHGPVATRTPARIRLGRVNERLEALGIPTPSPVRKWIVRVVLVLVVVAGVVGVAAYVRGRRDNGVQYETARVVTGELVATVEATGTLSPRRTVDVGPEISGRVRDVMVDVNETVHVGTVLAEIDTTQIDAQIAEARAQLQQAQANARLAQTQLDASRVALGRIQQLHGRQLASDQDRDTAQANVAQGEAQVAAAHATTAIARAALDRAQTDLRRARIVSPIEGVVLTRNVEPGMPVAATFSAPVWFTIAEDLGQLELRVDIDEADVGRVREGLAATFTVDAHQDQTFTATIGRLHFASHMVSTVVSYEAELDVDNTAGLLRPGMTATATIVTDRRPADLLAPNAALRFAPPVDLRFGGAQRQQDVPEGPHVWLLRNGTPTPLAVETRGTDGRNTAIHAEGIAEGTEVITGLAHVAGATR